MAPARAGRMRPARMAMMAMTTRSSIRVKPKFCPARAAAGCGQRLEVEFRAPQGG